MARAVVIRDLDFTFRSLAAPGLDEDDIFAAMQGLPGAPLWGQGRSWGGPEEAWSQEAERRRRHQRLLARWPPDARRAPGPQRRPAM